MAEVQIGVAIVAVIYVRAFAEQCVGFIEKQNAPSSVCRGVRPCQVLFRLTDIFVHYHGQIDAIDGFTERPGQHGGGSVPKQYIPAVEAEVKEFTAEGPLGFPVVDFAVTLTDGQFHAVDSNEMSFKLAARLAMTEGMPKCGPVLLEPIVKVTIAVPSEYTGKVHGLVSTRRGQILGFEVRDDWIGWDSLFANMPKSEIHDLIIELRSLTQGVGTYWSEFDHLEEISGYVADQIVAQRAETRGEGCAYWGLVKSFVAPLQKSDVFAGWEGFARSTSMMIDCPDD